MHFETYDQITGQLLGTFQQLDFGDLIQNQHCLKPIILRAVVDQETGVGNLKLFLESKGSWQDSNFGYYNAPDFTSSIESGSNLFTSFIQVPGADASSSNYAPIGWDGTSSDYIWLDAQIHNVTGLTQANFRLFFDQN
jgi:hypothetical protein